MKKIRSSQPAIPFTELSETQLFPVSIVNKKSLVSSIIAFELVARNSPYYDENSYLVLTNSPKISDLTKRDINSIYLRIMKQKDKSAVAQISAVSGTS